MSRTAATFSPPPQNAADHPRNPLDRRGVDDRPGHCSLGPNSDDIIPTPAARVGAVPVRCRRNCSRLAAGKTPDVALILSGPTTQLSEICGCTSPRLAALNAVKLHGIASNAVGRGRRGLG